MSEPDPGTGHTGRGRWRRNLRLLGFLLQLSLCVGLAIWSASSGEILWLSIAVILGLTAAWLGLREVRRRSVPPRQPSR